MPKGAAFVVLPNVATSLVTGDAGMGIHRARVSDAALALGA